jgi:hypothetical protein
LRLWTEKADSKLLKTTASSWNKRMQRMKIGGADGVRTHDLLDAIEARSQLRHGPTELTFEILP